MNKVQELDLELTFSEAIEVINFDDDAYHGSSTIKRVDFVAEYGDRYVFVEIKDPDCPDVKNPAAFQAKLHSEELIHSLCGKFRDTSFFRQLQGKEKRNIIYLVLISMQSLDLALLTSRQDQLKRSIPIGHDDWISDCAADCMILNFEQWKERFGDQSIRRISEGAA